MVIFLILKDKIGSKYTQKLTKLHHLKKFSRGGMPPNPLTTRDTSRKRDVYFTPILSPPPCLNMDLRP